MNTYEIGASEGGVLPVPEWSAADRVIVEAWKIADGLGKSLAARTFIPGVGLDRKHYESLLANFKKEVGSISAMLERLKHGPAFETLTDPIGDWRKRAADLPRWARQINESAEFGSLTGAIRDVGTKTFRDVGEKVLIPIGQGTIQIVKWLPWIVLGTLGIGIIWRIKDSD